MKNLSVEDIESMANHSLPLAALILLGVYCLKAFLIVIPISVLYVSAGVIFPTPWALIITFCCLIIEISITFYLGRRMGREKVEKLMKKNRKVSRFFNEQKDNERTICLLVRLLPFPFDLVSMYLGASGMKYHKYLIFSLLGIVPGMAAYVIAGHSILNPLSPEFLIPFSISTLISLIASLILYLNDKKKKAA